MTTANAKAESGSQAVRKMDVLVAIDRSLPAQWALELAARFANDVGANVILLNVVVPASGAATEFYTSLERLDTLHREEAEELLTQARKSLPDPVECAKVVRQGYPADEILDLAAISDVDLIVMGRQSRSRVGEFFIGSTADAVVKRARCPVVTVGHRSKWAAVKCLAGAHARVPVSAH